jgi:uncharacterized protein
MIQNFIHRFKKAVYLVVLIGFGSAHAGSYEDFFIAIKRDDGRAVKSLLARGFDPNTRDPEGQHGLYLALREPSPDAAQALLEAPKLDVNILNAKGESPLMIAVIKGQQDVAGQLIEKGADVNKTGWTPLHYAATTGHTGLIAMLIENHAFIDAESPNGTTPLMMAAMYGSIDAVKLLLAEGADTTMKNQQGLTAIQFAQRASRKDAADAIAQVLRSKQPAGKW